MRLRVLALLLLCLCAASNSFAAYVQSNGTSGSGTSVSLAYTSNNAAGGLLILRYGGGPPSVTISGSCTDTQGNTWNPIAAATGGVVEHQALQYVKSAAAGANTVTCTLSGSSSFFEFNIFEYSGHDPTSPLDKSTLNEQTNAGTSTDGVTTGNQTPTTDGQLIFSCTFRTGGSGSATTAGTGFTIRENVYGDGPCEDKYQGSAAAVAGTWTSDSADNDFISSLVTFKVPAAAANKALLLLGVQ